MKRFWSKVNKNTESGCWDWTAGRFNSGYGCFNLVVDGKKKARLAHRVAYELIVGPIEPGLVLDHRCHNPLCVNPSHLRACTQSQNAMNGLKHRDGSAPYKGAYRYGVKWRSQIRSNGKLVHLGCFGTPKDAHQAYCHAASILNGEFACVRGAE